MFIYFQQNKLRYEKGQLTPIFIVVIVILIIMAMLTVNLGKLGLIKTDTSNAADAGALAGGAYMANVFNAQAAANQVLINNHKLFADYEMPFLAFLIIMAAYSAAFSCAAQPCSSHHPCCGSAKCKSDFGAASSGITSAMLALAWFHFAQYETYKNMRKDAERGRDQAIELAYRYAFINSGIGNKLISGEPPSSAEEMRGDENNYAETFNDWVKGGKVTGGDYIWIDGQGRKHQVHVGVSTQGVGRYSLQYTLLPTIPLELLLRQASLAAKKGSGACHGCPCTAGVTFAMAGRILGYMLAVLGGLRPYWVEDNTDFYKLTFPICWVVDINPGERFSKRVRVMTWQEHKEQDYGLWNMRYPHTESWSEVNFEAEGTIYPVDASFDPDIIDTD